MFYCGGKDRSIFSRFFLEKGEKVFFTGTTGRFLVEVFV